MKPMKAYTHINRMVGLAHLVLFLSSYLPLFLIIIYRQIITNAEFLEWGGFKFLFFAIVSYKSIFWGCYDGNKLLR